MTLKRLRLTFNSRTGFMTPAPQNITVSQQKNGDYISTNGELFHAADLNVVGLGAGNSDALEVTTVTAGDDHDGLYAAMYLLLNREVTARAQEWKDAEANYFNNDCMRKVGEDVVHVWLDVPYKDNPHAIARITLSGGNRLTTEAAHILAKTVAEAAFGVFPESVLAPCQTHDVGVQTCSDGFTLNTNTA